MRRSAENDISRVAFVAGITKSKLTTVTTSENMHREAVDRSLMNVITSLGFICPISSTALSKSAARAYNWAVRRSRSRSSV